MKCFLVNVKGDYHRTTAQLLMDDGNRQTAIPLCLPDHYHWDPRTGRCNFKEGPRSRRLYVVEEALEKIRVIKGPVCVVSICGSHRKGKSYVLSEAFDQPNVFPLGHEFLPETRGIWLWITPEKYRDANGQEVTVLLLDSQGIDDYFFEESSGGIFTLVFLLSSLLIYNSQGVPTRRDLEGMKFIAELSKIIQLKSITEANSSKDGTEFLRKLLPRFIWLLRDVTVAFPSDCRNPTDYFLRRIFTQELTSSSGHRSNEVVEAILNFFSGFAAHALPPPTADERMLRRLNETRDKLNPSFLSALETFKVLLSVNMEAKCSLIDGDCITGQELAELVPIYVKMLNTSGIVDIELAWQEAQQMMTSRHKNAPLEILARGPLAIKAYNRALAEGKAYIKRVPIMFVGQGGTGKTTLKKSLKGEAFKKGEKSTDGIEKDPSYFKVSTEIWKTGEKGTETESKTSLLSFEDHATVQLICESLLKEKSIPLDVAKSTVSVEVSEQKDASSFGSSVEDRSLGLESSVDQPSTSSADVVITKTDSKSTRSEHVKEQNVTETHPSVTKLPEPIAASVESWLQSGEREEVVYSVLWDFGGQSVYYTTHPIFLTEKAIYILVSDLSRDPDEKANPRETEGLYKNNVDISCDKTNLDYLDFWMSSIYSLLSPDITCEETSADINATSPRRLPPVFLVCTHADEPYCESNTRDLALKRYEFLRTKIYSQHLFKDVFVVDNTKSGSEHECPEVRRLRGEVLAVAKELPQMKEAIPLKWLKYEKALEIRKESDKWIPLEEAKQIASNDCNIDDEEEFSTLLNFLHDQRILIHFSGSPELETMVILDPQWLIDVFKGIITVKRYEHSEEKVEALWLKLQETGILDERLIDHVWKPLFGNQKARNGLIAIMERLSLICSWPSSESSKQYLVPSMLMSPPTDEVIQLLESVKIPSLFAKFESGRVPPGLFSRLLLQFFQWCEKEWKGTVNPELFQDFAMFSLDQTEGSSVILVCHSSSIEIIFLSGNNDLDLKAEFAHGDLEISTCRAIHWQLTLILECMRNEFFWLANMRYQMCFCCPVCSQSVNCRRHGVRGCEECLHFLSQSDLLKLRCCDRAGLRRDRRIRLEKFVPWFLFSDEQKGRILINQRQAAIGRDVGVNQTDERRSVSRKEPIQSQASELEDIVTQIQESLQLDSASQVNTAEPENKRAIRCAAIPAEREITPARPTGPEDQTLALPESVIEAIQSQACAPNDIVCRFQEALQLDLATLENPGPEIKRRIRCLAIQAKSENRTDVVKYLRKITLSGTTGPLMNEDLDVRHIPFKQIKDLTFSLSGGDGWKLLAERLGLSQIDIRFLDKRTLNPSVVVLRAVGSHRHLSVGEVYDILVDCEVPRIADIM